MSSTNIKDGLTSVIKDGLTSVIQACAEQIKWLQEKASSAPNDKEKAQWKNSISVWEMTKSAYENDLKKLTN
jgi:hypothetical protein